MTKVSSAIVIFSIKADFKWAVRSNIQEMIIIKIQVK